MKISRVTRDNFCSDNTVEHLCFLDFYFLDGDEENEMCLTQASSRIGISFRK